MTTAHDTKPKTAAIIVAAGRGTRAGGDISKQWQYVAGRPIAAWTLDRFRVCGHVSTIILVLHQDDIMRDIEGISFDGITRVGGGETRNASVLCGLKEAQKQGVDQVLIHDVARPCISDIVIDNVIAALNTAKGAAPGLQVTDALWTHDHRQVSACAKAVKCPCCNRTTCNILPLLWNITTGTSSTASCDNNRSGLWFGVVGRCHGNRMYQSLRVIQLKWRALELHK